MITLESAVTGVVISVFGLALLWIAARVVVVSAMRGWKKEMGHKEENSNGKD